MLKGMLVILAVISATLIAPATQASAESCAAHLAKHGTSKAADIEYHILHGGHSPCKIEQDQQQAAERSQRSDSSNTESRQDSNDYDRKSRYCRKNWFC